MVFPMLSPVLDSLGGQLSEKDLLRLSMTNRALNKYFTDERFFKKIMEDNLWTDKLLATKKDDVQFILNNTPTRHYETTKFNNKVIRYSVFSNKGTMFAAFGNGCCIWVFRGSKELFFVNLLERREWNKVIDIAFSPDDNHIMVTGVVSSQYPGGTNQREALIYSISNDNVTLKSRITLGNRMTTSWFDNENIIYTQNDGESEKMRFIICSINNLDDILIFPIATFNKKVRKIMVSQHVSPRARKVVQIANQAANEGITLNQKLIDIGVAAGIDVTNMAALKNILDQNDECLPCYQLHARHDAVQVSECQCQCHNNTDKLLIFYGNGNLIHAKIITEKMISDVKEMIRSQRDDGQHENPNYRRLFYPLHACNDFDTVDYTFTVEGSLNFSNACFSPDHRYLYITSTRDVETPPQAQCMQIKPMCIDLESMIIKKTPGYQEVPWVLYDYEVRITANYSFVALFTDNSVVIWSTFHQGKSVACLNGFTGLLSSVALHPYLEELVVTNERLIHIYKSPLHFSKRKNSGNAVHVPCFQVQQHPRQN